MLTLRFHSPSEVTLGPARSFSLEGPYIRQAPHHEIVCRQDNGLWYVEDEAASLFECEHAVRIQFEDRQGRTSPFYGPFSHLRFESDICLSDGEQFADFLREPEQWRHRASGIRWRILNLLAGR